MLITWKYKLNKSEAIEEAKNYINKVERENKEHKYKLALNNEKIHTINLMIHKTAIEVIPKREFKPKKNYPDIEKQILKIGEGKNVANITEAESNELNKKVYKY